MLFSTPPPVEKSTLPQPTLPDERLVRDWLADSPVLYAPQDLQPPNGLQSLSNGNKNKMPEEKKWYDPHFNSKTVGPYNVF